MKAGVGFRQLNGDFADLKDVVNAMERLLASVERLVQERQVIPASQPWDMSSRIAAIKKELRYASETIMVRRLGDRATRVGVRTVRVTNRHGTGTDLRRTDFGAAVGQPRIDHRRLGGPAVL